MNNSVTRYKDKNSFVHSIDPLTKLICFVLMTTSVFVAQTFLSLTLVFIFTFMVSVSSKTNWLTYFRLLLWSIIMSILYGLFYSLILMDFEKGFIASFEIGYRFYILILIALVFTSSTRETEIASAIDSLISPLKYIKVPTYEISVMITLAIRFIPLMIEDANQIRRAQSSRGFSSVNGNIINRTKSFFISIMPLLFVSFQRAEDISKSMIVRGYVVGQKRSKFQEINFGFREIISLTFSILVLVIMILFVNGVF